MAKNKPSILWNILGVITLLLSIVQAISLINNFDDTTILFDFILIIVMCILLFSKNFIGVVILTFSSILGLLNFQNIYSTLYQIIILMLSFPLWIERFSKR